MFSPPLGWINVCSFGENPIPNFPRGWVHEVIPLISFSVETKKCLGKLKTNGSCSLIVVNVVDLNHQEETRPLLSQRCCQPLNRQRLNLRQLEAQFTGSIYCSAWVHRRAALLLWSVRTLLWQLVQDRNAPLDLVKHSHGTDPSVIGIKCDTGKMYPSDMSKLAAILLIIHINIVLIVNKRWNILKP